MPKFEFYINTSTLCQSLSKQAYEIYICYLVCTRVISVSTFNHICFIFKHFCRRVLHQEPAILDGLGQVFGISTLHLPLPHVLRVLQRGRHLVCTLNLLIELLRTSEPLAFIISTFSFFVFHLSISKTT